ncbi:MAG: hypothetical protein WKF34_04285 [Pyrinomonadaceae bacterium]
MRIRAFALVVLLFASAAAAQSPSKILSRANKALGGEKTLNSITSWQQTGKITRVSDGAGGSFFATASGGYLYGSSFDLGGFEVATGYNGKSGWTRDSKNGLRTLTGEAGNAFQSEAVYRNTRWLKAKDEKSKISSGGVADVDGRPTNVVVLTTPKNTKIKLYFDQASDLLVREELAGKTLDYSDYRPVNGIKTPFAIKLASDGEVYDVKLDAVNYNGTVARSSYDFPTVSNEPIPNIAGLLDEVRKNADKIDEILENYSYTETRTEREMRTTGDLVEKDSEKRLLTFYKGYRITRTIEKNGRPLSPSDQAKEDKEAEKYVAEIEKKIEERERKAAASRDTSTGVAGQPTGARQRFTIGDALKGSLLINPRRERFKDREVIVFDYEPNPKFNPKTQNEKLFALCVGAVWVDVASKQVVRLEAVLSKSAGNFFAKAKRGTSFTLDNEFVNNEIWLPSRADISVQIKILFVGIDINNLVTYGDYRRFSTEVKDAVVGDEKKP